MPEVLPTPSSVMDRLDLLLEPFRDTDGLTLTELCRRTGFPRSSAHRMLLQLVRVGWMRRSGTTYHLGPKIVELGALAQAHDRIHSAALRSMYALHRETGLAVHLTVLDNDQVVYLEKVSGAQVTDSTWAGQRRLAEDTVAGLALLARRDRSHPALTGSNGHSIVGGVVHGGECFRHAVAAFAAGDGEIAALSLAGPVEAMSEDAVRRLRRAADHLETTLTA
ncbi:IclR family transcriptional regulator [Rhodococcus rhodochrous]|uniref:IclR family transcriptional regulator n=1 Tax=Rhodococcus rhodochrous TaxID=1829 RepID=UPI000474C11C|nr:helix-turn-helix domain-containing protein [Rhodococcus rhodochrous]